MAKRKSGEPGANAEQRIGKAVKELAATTGLQLSRLDAQVTATELNLSGLGLESLPESLGKFTQLRALYLDSNQLNALPESLGNLSRLQTLVLNHNQLSAVPESLGNLTQLQTLFLSGNQLSAVPESLGNLAELQTLVLTSNQLSAVPEWLGKLTRLQMLYLSGNQLNALPESLGNLTQLQTLFLDSNQLNALPDSLRNLNKLERLLLHNNPALGIPGEVLGPTLDDVLQRTKQAANPAAILEYYFRSRHGRPLNEAKLILIGRGDVGKTSLVRRLVHDKFDSKERKTEGIQITDWTIKLNRQEEDVRLHVWDFGGQEIMHATHQFFLTKRSLYLLVINGRQGSEDAEAEYWLRLIESFGGNSPVIVVLNKDQGASVRSQSARAGAKIRGYPRVCWYRL
jgi:internalin A